MSSVFYVGRLWTKTRTYPVIWFAKTVDNLDYVYSLYIGFNKMRNRFRSSGNRYYRLYLSYESTNSNIKRTSTCKYGHMRKESTFWLSMYTRKVTEFLGCWSYDLRVRKVWPFVIALYTHYSDLGLYIIGYKESNVYIQLYECRTVLDKTKHHNRVHEEDSSDTHPLWSQG